MFMASGDNVDCELEWTINAAHTWPILLLGPAAASIHELPAPREDVQYKCKPRMLAAINLNFGHLLQGIYVIKS